MPQDESPSVLPPGNADASLDAALDILHDYLTKNEIPPLPPELQDNEKLAALLQYLAEVRASLASLSCGDLSTPVTLRGYTGGLLKTFQANVRHMLWMINQVAAGRLTQRIDFMGDFAKSFNVMTHAIQTARIMQKHQEELYAKLAGDLKLEVDAKIKAQEALKHELEHQRELAETDVLTGVANRRAFLSLAHHELERCRRNNATLCLSMIDVDNFKTINDTLGHQIGDKVLRHLAAAITQNLRSYDIVGRYGGDEFILLFPSTNIEDAKSALERLSKSIQDGNSFAYDGSKYTISIGLAAMSPHNQDMALEDLIAKADQALYLAKKSGRSRVVVSRNEEPSRQVIPNESGPT